MEKGRTALTELTHTHIVIPATFTITTRAKYGSFYGTAVLNNYEWW